MFGGDRGSALQDAERSGAGRWGQLHSNGNALTAITLHAEKGKFTSRAFHNLKTNKENNLNELNPIDKYAN